MKKILFLLFAAIVCNTASAAITPSTEDNPVWYQLVNSSNQYLAWQDWGTVYAKIETDNNLAGFTDEMVQWAFIPSGDGYKLYNNARGQYLGITTSSPYYVNVTDTGIEWTVTEDDNGQITLKCSKGNLYNNYFVYAGDRPAEKFTPVLVESDVTSIKSMVNGRTADEVYDLQGRRLTKGVSKGLYIQGGRLMLKK